MTTRRTVRAATLALALSLLIGVPAASAAGVSRSGGNVDYAAATGESNNVIVTRDGDSIDFTDSGGITITIGPGCDPGGALNKATCPVPSGTPLAVTVGLGDLNDSANLSAVANAVATLTGGTGDDTLTGTGKNDTLRGEDGEDRLKGLEGADVLDGGANATGAPTPGSGVTPGPDRADTADYSERTAGINVSLDGVANDTDGDTLTNVENVDGGSGNDLVVGDAGTNRFYGYAGNDTLAGGGGDDALIGDFGGAAGGNDVLNGEDGDDYLSGGVGSDQLGGGAGDDFLMGSGFFGPAPDDVKRDGDDTYNGGEGVDTAELHAEYVEPVTSAYTAIPVRVTLDGVADDGPAGQADNVAADVENVTTGSANDTIRASDAFNTISSGPGDDVIDALGGSDVIDAGDRDDTITARDGYADDVICGRGTDKATVDQLDRVRADCEQVDRLAVTPALQDAQPAVSITTPIAGARVDPAAGVPVAVTATDDRGVKEVRLLDDGKQIAVDTTAPYEFLYKPLGSDVGRNTLIAVAIDTSEQSGSDFRTVTVAKFKVASPTFLPTPKRDRRAPFRYRFAGKIPLPAGVTPRQACRSGTMQAQTKSTRGTTFSSRRVKIRTNCSWGVSVSFRSKKRLGNGRLKVRVRFSGNPVLASFYTPYKKIRAG